MTTPGRTHIPWETQDGQVAELISYISFLEAKLQYLQLHHEHCNLRSAPLDSDLDMELPYLPPDVVIANEEAEVAKVHIPLTPPLPLEPFPIASVPAVQPMPKKGTIPRWKRIVDQMMAGWGQPSSWEDKRMDIGLNSVAQNQVALTLILGLRNENPQHDPSHAFPFPDMETHSPPASPTEALIYSARQYALDTKASKMNADFVVPLHTFRELVFASLCVVMEQQGLPIDTINGLMRICMSSSGPANLYRLRRGALWVNRVIAGTLVAKMGWRRSGTEFFLLSGRPVSQYGLLWEACVHSFPYLCERLAWVGERVVVPSDEPGWTPFSIPLIIRGIVGEALTLQQICTALDYDIAAL